ncbi:MAG: hypothetical protein JWM59_2034 [Verrucomicrobiales bacterium]|nr:hypothetical protein [Verrucomicrobiales bacterium]
MSTHSPVFQRLWRQGDVLIAECGPLPPGCLPFQGRVIAQGEAAGHAHRLTGPRASASLLHPPLRRVRPWNRAEFCLQVTGPKCVISHPEHRPIPLEPGCYMIWRQREFDPRSGASRTAGD